MILDFFVFTYKKKNNDTNEQKPVEYIGLVAAKVEAPLNGVISLQLLLKRTQNSPESLQYIVKNITDRNAIIADLLSLGLQTNELPPEIHLIESNKPMADNLSKMTADERHDFFSQAIKNCSVQFERLGIRVNDAALKKPNQNSLFNQRKNNDSINLTQESKNKEKKECCKIG